jgi:hypothetical protein
MIHSPCPCVLIPDFSPADKLRNSKYGSREDVALMTQCFDRTTKLSFRNADEPSYIKFGTGRDRDASVGIRSGQLRLPG